MLELEEVGSWSFGSGLFKFSSMFLACFTFDASPQDVVNLVKKP